MGEVYLGHDTSLNRRVALKVLPADVAANHDRMRRFKQEAISAASLNHPTIAHIYEIGESDGRCLAKDPDQRYQNIKDVAIELKEVRRDLQENHSTVPASGSWISEPTVSQDHAALTNPTPSSPSTRASSAEFIVNELKRHKLATIIAVSAVLLVMFEFDNLRSDPGFVQLVRKLGLPE